MFRRISLCAPLASVLALLLSNEVCRGSIYQTKSISQPAHHHNTAFYITQKYYIIILQYIIKAVLVSLQLPPGPLKGAQLADASDRFTQRQIYVGTIHMFTNKFIIILCRYIFAQIHFSTSTHVFFHMIVFMVIFVYNHTYMIMHIQKGIIVLTIYLDEQR